MGGKKRSAKFQIDFVSVSEDNRRLMADILNKSANDQAEMSTRVAALLAGTSLTTTAGTSVRRRDDIGEVQNPRRPPLK